MSPRFEEGTILIIEPEREPKDRDFVIAVIEKQNTVAVFKQILIDGEERFLKSLNEDYRTSSLRKDSVIVGCLVQARTDFLR